jgi:hypothetical protein
MQKQHQCDEGGDPEAEHRHPERLVVAQPRAETKHQDSFSKCPAACVIRTIPGGLASAGLQFDIADNWAIRETMLPQATGQLRKVNMRASK